jgi:general secretion pathway protein M
MDMTLPEGLRGRLLAATLTLTVLCAAWFAVAAPLIAWHQVGREELAQDRVLLLHMQEAAATLPVLERDRAASVRPATTTLLPGGTDAMAAAAMQGNVQAMAVAAGVSLASMETLPAEARGAYRRIGLRVAATAPWPVLVEFLRAASRGEPRMLIDDLVLHPQPSQDNATAVPISASLTLLAFRPASAGKSP